ncbi:hypothetical protein OSB04_015920, partial [Centaurea solstitialis]
MGNEIQPHFDTITLITKAQKRWRIAYHAIYFTNTLVPIAKVAKNPPSYANNDPDDDYDHVELVGVSTVNQAEIADMVNNKNLAILGHRFNGVKGLARALETNLEDGINGQDTERRKVVFGSNTYKQPPRKGYLHFVVEAFTDTTILILMACAALSLGFGIGEDGAENRWYDRGSIFLGLFLFIVVSTVSSFKQERQFDRLSKIRNDVKVDVVRDKRRQKISISDVVVGDLVVLNVGDQVPADGLFVDGHSLAVDESSMTGESDYVGVDAVRNPFLISGSKVGDGHGRMLVIAVGMNTSWGKMMMMVNRNDSDDDQTPLQSCLNEWTSRIVKVGLAIASFEVLIVLVRYSTGYTEDENGNRMYNWRCTDTNDVLDSVTRDVLAIAEGLLLAVSLTRVYCTKGMMDDQAMVRSLSACETMGSVTVICTDKTGTLTMNQMHVTRFWLGLDRIEDNSSTVDAKVLQLYHQAVGLNTTGSVCRSVSGTTPEYCGSPIEKAILSWAVTSLGMDIETLKQGSTVLRVKTFNSNKKWSGVFVRKREDNTIHEHRKGAAEMVLGMCSSYYQKTGLTKSINHEDKASLENLIRGMAASSLVCIAFAHKQIPEKELKHSENGTATYKTLNEEGLTLLGIVGIQNPCRPRVKEAINTCRSAGVDVKMITGDNVFTAKAIATECGIFEVSEQVCGGEVIEGETFRSYTEEERMNKVEKIRVMARSSPLDRLLMVQCLKKKGHVVAVTGNCARALKEADIGLSMGIQGTEVAKNTSDIIILDDDFNSVIMGLRWGRCVYNNIQKYIQFQLTANVAALVLNFIKAASAGGVPLTAAQLLWINLIINTIGVVALATEFPTEELMHKPPVGRVAPLITNVMWKNLLAQFLYQIVILLTFQFKGRTILNVNERVNNTIIFNTFILCQVFNLFNSMKLEKRNVFEGLGKNVLFLGIVGVIMVLQVLMVEFLKNLADTEELNGEQWGICVAFAALSWPVGWFVKLIPVSETPFLSYIQGKISKGSDRLPSMATQALLSSGVGWLTKKESNGRTQQTRYRKKKECIRFQHLQATTLKRIHAFRSGGFHRNYDSYSIGMCRTFSCIRYQRRWGWKKKGHVFAVASNCARALKEANIGLSMGIQGTEVAKKTSDIIILNDDFTYVIIRLRWGRCVYNNIQKYIQYQLTTNVAALVLNFIKASSVGGVVALATDFPTEELMHKLPLGRVASLKKLIGEQRGSCIAFASLSWPLAWFVKMISVSKMPFLSYIREKISRASDRRLSNATRALLSSSIFLVGRSRDPEGTENNSHHVRNGHHRIAARVQAPLGTKKAKGLIDLFCGIQLLIGLRIGSGASPWVGLRVGSWARGINRCPYGSEYPRNVY